MEPKKEKIILCSKCGERTARDLHACPYQAEINDDPDPEFCDCCEECEQQCRDDI